MPEKWPNRNTTAWLISRVDCQVSWVYLRHPRLCILCELTLKRCLLYRIDILRASHPMEYLASLATPIKTPRKRRKRVMKRSSLCLTWMSFKSITMTKLRTMSSQSAALRAVTFPCTWPWKIQSIINSRRHRGVKPRKLRLSVAISRFSRCRSMALWWIKTNKVHHHAHLGQMAPSCHSKRFAKLSHCVKAAVSRVSYYRMVIKMCFNRLMTQLNSGNLLDNY